jgi:hypothetical protein
MFICNHCPYVKSILNNLIQDIEALKSQQLNTVAIMANDPNEHQEDSFENMQYIAQSMNFPFPYLLDSTQKVAKAYGAVCTPDFFGYNQDLKLQYRGRFSASRKDNIPNAKRELYQAMTQIIQTGQGPKTQISSMGCSIKWR